MPTAQSERKPARRARAPAPAQAHAAQAQATLHPGREDCRAALDRVMASTPFEAAPRLSAFLRFVVEAALDGHGHTVKAYTVAVQAFGRSADFDPATDAIVRVEARRLRAALDRYYVGAGDEDPLLITIPRGSYVPQFHWRAAPDREARGGTNSRTAVLVAECRARVEALKLTMAALQTTLGRMRVIQR